MDKLQKLILHEYQVLPPACCSPEIVQEVERQLQYTETPQLYLMKPYGSKQWTLNLIPGIRYDIVSFANSNIYLPTLARLIYPRFIGRTTKHFRILYVTRLCTSYLQYPEMFEHEFAKHGSCLRIRVECPTKKSTG